MSIWFQRDPTDVRFSTGPPMFAVSEVVDATVSPLHDLILEQRLVVFQREAGQLQEVHAPSLRSNAEQVTWLQQEKDSHPGGAGKKKVSEHVNDGLDVQDRPMVRQTRGSWIPAALNARSSWEAIVSHFLEGDHTLFLDPSHLSRSTCHKLPQVNHVVIQQWQQAALGRSKSDISVTHVFGHHCHISNRAAQTFVLFLHLAWSSLTCPGRKWICVTAVVSLCSPVNSTPGAP